MCNVSGQVEFCSGSAFREEGGPMPRTRMFIIDGKSIEFQTWHLEWSADLLDVEVVGRRSKETIPAGQSRTQFEGVTVEGEQVQGTYRVLERRDDDTYVLETWNRDASVGSEGN